MNLYKYLLVVFLFQLTITAKAQGDDAYFVVIGTFKIMDNADRLATEARQKGLTAEYAICPAVGLYYVYALQTLDHLKAHNLSIKINEETQFKSVWVYKGKLGLEDPTIALSDLRAARVIESESKLKNNLTQQEHSSEAITSIKPFYFRVVSNFDGKELTGNLLLKESDSPDCFQSVKSGGVVFLKEPQSKQKSYTLVSLMPGYKQNSIIFFFGGQSIEKGPHNEDVITLTVDKGKSPDFIEFKHVYFHEHSSSLRLVSYHELDELSCLLKENPKTKIIVHGHASKQEQEAYELEFFSGAKEITVLKDLSAARAESVKTYLVQRGIERSRILTKGEDVLPFAGEQLSVNFKNNVEVELVKSSLSTL